MELRSRCVIPTNSLYLIYREVGDSLDPLISFLRATSTSTENTVKTKPHKLLSIEKVNYTRRRLRYNYNSSRSSFKMDSLIEAMNQNGIADLWIHEIRLRLKHPLGLFDFIFRNSPLTPGTEACKYVENYMSELIRDGWIKVAQIRHLPLVSTKSIPVGQNLAFEEISSPDFIKWMAEKTNGLIKLKLIKRKDETTFIDYNIKDLVV